MNFHIKWKPKAIRVVQKYNMAADFELWSISGLERDFFPVGSEDFMCLYYHSKPVKHFHTIFTTLKHLYYCCAKVITHFLGNLIIIYSEMVRVTDKKSYQFVHLLVTDVSVNHHQNSSHVRHLFTSVFRYYCFCRVCQLHPSLQQDHFLTECSG